ncbi:tRNA (N6-threonylcarbamoyladenosine(37)-N6)-methyltransferase TrmO [Glaciecola sp. SC05]|uniref:tRNA (N6-threonylcarbamoyladenosine(37)-N6)-methyltransferase TrmO n=1 Tax=Glaciecola sp. SC05 TaxID=1987355 RepID=UPI00352969AE
MTDNILPIGHILTPYTQKFGIPRQGAGLSIAKGTIVFDEHIRAIDACEGIMQFSHLWIIFKFHQNTDKGWSSKVRPPRLGGNAKTGVFATRSSFRPNGIGMSVVKLLNFKNNTLEVEGVDMLSGTPIIDIKPYVGYADSIENAQSGYAAQSPENTLTVQYEPSVLNHLSIYQKLYADLRELIEASLTADPRPAYKSKKDDEKQYHIRLYDIEIRFTVKHNYVLVQSIHRIKF